MTALSLQANNALFIDKSQSERKDLMAQFMGLDMFDKLYETATNDIKDVNALIRNFKRTDFTTELAQKETDLGEKKIEYGELDKEKTGLETRKAELEEQIVGLSQQIVPIQGNLDIDELNRKVKKIEDELTTWGDTKFDKIQKHTETKELVREAKEMVDSKVTINGTDIQTVYSNYQREQKDLVEAEKVYSTAKLHLSLAEEKINHLDNHKYDPNCEFCCDNSFVKDAMKAKETISELLENVKQATIVATGIQQTLDSWEGVEEQFHQWKECTDEHKRLIVIRDRLESDIKNCDSKIELLQHQLETTKADIKRYNDNEETITNNQALDIQIQNVRREKQGVERQITDVNKEMLKLMSDVGATKT